MQRAALYIRVSTEEQALHGYSLDAQKQALTKYAKEHDMYIIDYYVDDGYSARKKYTNRKEFMRMLGDVQHDKLDIILFIKLDRWFRSVKDYYKIQEILEVHNVGWKTTEENYDTTTTNGRLYVNIRLSVAQDESDRTSDRIKFVFESKVSRGEVISGAQPIGLKIENKRLVHDETTMGMIQDLFVFFASHQSKYAAIRYIYEKYGIRIDKSTMRSILTNTLYMGEYRGNPNYCEPLIDDGLFSRVQKAIAAKGVRGTPSGRIYIFSGLLRCAGCGRIMSGQYVRQDPHEYYHYRCNIAVNEHLCDNNTAINEKYIENWLLENVESEIDYHIKKYQTQTAKKPKPAIDRAKIKRKLAKLKELYLNELITIDEYKTDYDIYNAQLEKEVEAFDPMPSIKILQDFLQSDFKEIYVSLDKKKRQALWRGIIKEIQIDSSKNLKTFFS